MKEKALEREREKKENFLKERGERRREKITQEKKKEMSERKK